jgi:hypothetical protein
MTKKERKEFEEAIANARLLGALRWTEEVLPDIPKPTYPKETSGWRMNQHSDYGRVWEAWSNSSSHGFGRFKVDGSSASQGAVELYSTKLRALKALRHGIEILAAAKLANIDRHIAELTALPWEQNS